MIEDKYSFRIKGVCVLEYDDKFLVIKRNVDKHGPMLILPGGKVEVDFNGETRDILENTVRREIHEELGFHIDTALNYLCSNLYIDSSGVQIIDVTFHCCLDELPMIVPDPQEVPEYFWISKDEIKSSGCSGLIDWKIDRVQNLKIHRDIF